MRILSFFLALCLTAALLGRSEAQPPAPVPYVKLPASLTAPPNVYFALKPDTNCKALKWIIPAGLTPFPVELLKDPNTKVLCGPAGVYVIQAYGAAGDQASDLASCTVTIGAPAPAPGPNPAPDPTPTPGVKAAWAILILDNNARTPAIGQLLASKTLLPALQARGVTLRVLDVHDPLVGSLSYQQFVDGAGGPPILLALATDGKKVAAVKLPGDEAGVLALFPAPAQLRPACGPNGCPFTPPGGFIFPEFAR
jgi:hypothetical protein